MADVLAAVPVWLEDTGKIAGAVVALIGALYGIGRVIRSSWRFVKNVDETLTVTKQTHHLVRHHLGPNGSTPPLHTRVAGIERRMVRLEAAHDIEDDEVDGA
jgi:hypothetical protein